MHRDLARLTELAKHLEPLKGGKVPVEILIRGKDAEQNAKHFEKCLDVIKGGGVRLVSHYPRQSLADILLRKGWGRYLKMPQQDRLQMNGRKLLATFQKTLKRSIYLRLFPRPPSPSKMKANLQVLPRTRLLEERGIADRE